MQLLPRLPQLIRLQHLLVLTRLPLRLLRRRMLRRRVPLRLSSLLRLDFHLRPDLFLRSSTLVRFSTSAIGLSLKLLDLLLVSDGFGLDGGGVVRDISSVLLLGEGDVGRGVGVVERRRMGEERVVWSFSVDGSDGRLEFHRRSREGTLRTEEREPRRRKGGERERTFELPGIDPLLAFFLSPIILFNSS